MQRPNIAIVHPHSSSISNPLLWKLIWNIPTIPKVKNFLWRASSNFLATRANLFHRKLTLDPLCPFCHIYPETIEHVLLACPWSQKCWFIHPLHYRPPLQQLTTLGNWLSFQMIPSSTPFSKTNAYTHFAFLLWNIWKTRCSCVFNDIIPNPALVASQAFLASSEFLESKEKSKLLHQGSVCNLRPPPKPKWIPPLTFQLKINCDASWTTTGTGIAAIVRDSSGSLIAGNTDFVQATTPLVAEALALRSGVCLARSMPQNHFIFEVDSLQLVNFLNNSSLPSAWAVLPLIEKIKDLAVDLSSHSWVWTSRYANMASDCLALLARQRKCPTDWFQFTPTSLSQLLVKDASFITV